MIQQTSRRFGVDCLPLLVAAFWILSAWPLSAQSAPASATANTGYIPTLTFDVASIRDFN
jgi:hypothetical protein